MTASKADRGPAITVGGHRVSPGKRRTIEIPFARLPTDTWMSLPVSAINGWGDGPRIWFSAAVHGDELNGVEIIRRLLRLLDPMALNGSVIAIPIVNVFGFISESRYLPDRRDLNRSFPGSSRGSLASRLAHFFMTEIAESCAYGIDFHTGSDHRSNLPQVQAALRERETRRCAEAFGAPVMLHSRVRDGSMREAATRKGIHVLLFEGGEAMRFDEEVIEAGVNGALRVMAALGMREHDAPGRLPPPRTSFKSQWVRARRSGIVRLTVRLGEWTRRGETLGVISDPFGRKEVAVRATTDGLVIGRTNNPLASQGTGLVHIAECENGEG